MVSLVTSTEGTSLPLQLEELSALMGTCLESGNFPLWFQRADEEAARLYEEFVQSFKADDTPGGKAFVRGGTINPSERPKPDSESDPRGRHVDLSYGCTSNLVVCVCDMKIHPFFQGCLAALYLWFIQENLSFYVQLRPVLTVSVYGWRWWSDTLWMTFPWLWPHSSI